MSMNRNLGDLFRQTPAREQLARAWQQTEAAADFVPLPAGQYNARILRGELSESKTNSTPGYRLTFQVTEGEYQGRQFWHNIWLTQNALPMAKRDLGKIGVTSLEQLERPLPQGIRCRVNLTVRRDDNGCEFNRVRSFEVLGIDPPEVNPFAPIGAPVAPTGTNTCAPATLNKNSTGGVS